MAGELIVQTLKGPTSGANAGKVIVADGHILDASAGFVPAAGQVVQELHNRITTNSSFSSSGYTDMAGFNMNITPEYSDSLIIISVWAKTKMVQTSDQCGHDHRLLRDNTVQVHKSSWQSYFNRSQLATDIYPPLDFTIVDQPNTTSQVNYKVQGRIYGGSHGGWSINSNGGTALYTMTIKEIKQ
jgi:hypothetical protein